MVGGVAGPHARCVEVVSRFGEARLGAALRNRARRSCEQGRCSAVRRGKGREMPARGGVGPGECREGRVALHGGARSRWAGENPRRVAAQSSEEAGGRR